MPARLRKTFLYCSSEAMSSRPAADYHPTAEINSEYLFLCQVRHASGNKLSSAALTSMCG
jgi:hypothetical protein